MLNSRETSVIAHEVTTNDVRLLPKVKAFLDSIARNSLSSKTTYSSAINHFQNYLCQDQFQQKYQGRNCETILQPLLENTWIFRTQFFKEIAIDFSNSCFFCILQKTRPSHKCFVDP